MDVIAENFSSICPSKQAFTADSVVNVRHINVEIKTSIVMDSAPRRHGRRWVIFTSNSLLLSPNLLRKRPGVESFNDHSDTCSDNDLWFLSWCHDAVIAPSSSGITSYWLARKSQACQMHQHQGFITAGGAAWLQIAYQLNSYCFRKLRNTGAYLLSIVTCLDWSVFSNASQLAYAY